MEENLHEAIVIGNEERVKEILRMNPSLDVNWGNEEELGYATLRCACESGQVAIFSILLAHPDIDVNQKDQEGHTSFSGACGNGNTSCVREMLKDSRVKVNEPNNYGETPLWRAADQGHLDVFKWWIASGREMDLGKPGDIRKTDAIGGAKRNDNTEIVTLLERFQNDATKTRSEVRVELGITGQSPSPVSLVTDMMEVTHTFCLFPIQISLWPARPGSRGQSTSPSSIPFLCIHPVFTSPPRMATWKR